MESNKKRFPPNGGIKGSQLDGSCAALRKVFTCKYLMGGHVIGFLCTEADLAILRLVSHEISAFATLDVLWEKIFVKKFGALWSSDRSSTFLKWLEWTTICHSAVVVLVTPSHPYKTNKANGEKLKSFLNARAARGLPSRYYSPLLSSRNVHFYDETIIFGSYGFWCQQHNTDLAFGLGDFTVECWIRLLKEWKDNDIMFCNYGFFNSNGGVGMDLYVCSAWHTGPLTEDENGIFATNDCEAFNLIDDEDDVKREEYNKICDDNYHHIAYCRRNGVLFLYHDGRCVAEAFVSSFN